jgi:predicted acetyltransferase
LGKDPDQAWAAYLTRLDNLASAAVIERLGGELEDVRIDPDGLPKRRYWIP